MADVVKGNAVVGQSGGPTAVINQSLVGVIRGIGRCGNTRGNFTEYLLNMWSHRHHTLN